MGAKLSATACRQLWDKYQELGSASLAGKITGIDDRTARGIIQRIRDRGLDDVLTVASTDAASREYNRLEVAPEPDKFNRLILPTLPESVMVLPDLQFPYAHPDWLAFLQAVKDKFRPSMVIGIGDEVDSYALSSYDKDPETMQPSYEYARALEDCRMLFDLFPNVLALDSNHGKGRLEKARIRGGFLRAQVADYQQFIGAPKGWGFYSEVRLGDVLFHHGDGEKKLSRTFLERDVPEQFGRHYSVVHGHRHESAGRQAEISVGNKDFWCGYTGALINPFQGPFGYTKPRKAKLGCAVLIHGEFKRVRLLVDDENRWTGIL